MSDNEEIALAYLLYTIYYEAIGSDHWAWDELAPEEREAWVQISQYILATYETKETPDHR